MSRIPVPVSAADAAGNVQQNVSVTVKNRASGGNVTLYAQETGGSTVSNPLTTDVNGRAFAYADRQGLRLDYSAAGFTNYTEYREDAAQPDFVSSLPASPVDGQEVYFQNAAMATAGVVWHLRYRAGGGTYKWEFVGGPALRTLINTYQSTATGSYTDLSTVGPDVTAPLAGEYDVTILFEGSNGSGGNYAVASFQVVGGAAAQDDNRALAYSDAATTISTSTRTTRFTVAAGDVLRMKYLSTPAGTAYFARRAISIVPIRVG